MIDSTSNIYDKKISFFVAFYFVASATNATMKNVLPIPTSLMGAVSAMWGVLIVYFLLKALGPMWRRSSRIMIGSYILFITLYLFSAINCGLRDEPLLPILRSTAFLTFAWWIPVGVAVCSVRDKSVLYQTYLKASYWISVIMVINLIFHKNDVVDGTVEYDMFFGFALITPALTHINEYYNKKQSLFLLLSILEVLALLLYGNRSILLSVVFFVLFKSLIANRSKSAVKPILLSILFIVAFVFWEVIAANLISFFDLFGMQSRTLEMAVNGAMTDSSGRDELWEQCWRMTKERPITGWGIGGECFTLAKFLNSGIASDNFMAASAHNGIIQLLVELGLILGPIAIMLMIWPMLKINRIHDKVSKELILIFFSSYGVTRMVSADGFLIAPQVAIYLYLFYFRNHLKTN